MSLTEKVIQCVKKHEILFDQDHPEYKNYRKKDNVWNLIGKEINQDGEEVKKKWKNIRDCYQKCLRTSNPNNVVKRSYKNWQWADQMEFCRPYIECRKSETNVFGDLENDEDLSMENCEIKLESTETSIQSTSTTIEDSYNPNKRKIEASESSNQRVDKIIDFLQFDATDLIFLGYSNTIKRFSPKRQAIVKMKIAKIIMEEEISHCDEMLS